MNTIDKQYQDLLLHILRNGTEKKDRTGTGTKSIFGYQIRHNMNEGFPLLTTKKMAWKTLVTELLWFLNGDTNIKYLVDNGCHIWDGDAYKRYKNVYEIESRESTYALEELYMLSDLTQEQFIDRIKKDSDFAKKWGELGPIYGKQWRKWQGWMDYGNEGNKGSLWFDQIQRLIQMLKTEPDSRRLMVSAWNVAEIDDMVLPPCHYGFQVYTRELTYSERYAKWFTRNYETGMEYDEAIIPEFDNPYYTETPTRAISLMWNQRSVDTFLGLPFNIASYGLLLTLLGKLTNMVPEDLIGNLGDTHLYLNHLDQARQQIERKASELPNLKLKFDFECRDGYLVAWDKIKFEDIELSNYNSHPAIKAPLSN